MDQEKLISHVENLVPGFVTLALLATLVPANQAFPIKNQKVLEVVMQPVIAGAVATASAYLVGAAVFSASRLIVDTLSLLTFRWMLLLLFRRRSFTNRCPMAVNRQYMEVLENALRKPATDAIRIEVGRRRERARLVRTLLFPALIGVWPAFGPGGAALVFLSVVLVYAYTEVSIFQEAQLAA